MDTTTNISRTHKVDFGELHRKLGLSGEQVIVKVTVKDGNLFIETREGDG